MGVIARVCNALIWNKALDQVAADNYDEALSTLLKINVDQLRRLKLDYYMEKAFLLFKNQERGDAKASIEKALSIINENKKISVAKADYRRKYLELLIARLHGHRAEIAMSFEDINLNKVPKSTKHYFPLRDHPDWIEFRY